MIVDLRFYRFTYGAAIADAEFPRLAARAERAVSQMTHGRVTADSFASLPAYQQSAVKNAICAQIEYYTLLGSSVSVTGDTTAGGWTVGKVRVNGTGQSGAGAASRGASLLCPAAIAALEQTGLLNPQTATVDAPAPLLPGGWFFC